MMRVWLGHVVNHFQIMRSGLSCLHACYRFTQQALGRRVPVWPSVRYEMRLVMGLVFVGQADWGAAHWPEVYLGDSSTYGMALMSTQASTREVRQAMEFREKWRLVEVEEEGGNEPLGVHTLAEVDHEIRGYAPGASLGLSTKFGQRLLNTAAELQEDKHSRHTLRHTAHRRPSIATKVVELSSEGTALRDSWHRSERYKLIAARAWKHTEEHVDI
jgi:hypothetical protein